MESRSDENRVSRHVMLSTTRGVVTELELVGDPSGDVYVIRYRNSSEGSGKILDSGSWVGFRYHNSHWSFVKQ